MLNDVRTKALVLRRTNYGEADRILNLLTPEGKISAIAKSVRKEKSKLAGGIEMFSLIDVVVHQGKSEMGTITSAKMIKFYSHIMTDFSRMELAALILKKAASSQSDMDFAKLFESVVDVFEKLDQGEDLELIETWFWFNFVKASGEEVNLYRDTNGNKLVEGETYTWDFQEVALRPEPQGKISTNEIKLMRLMLTAKLAIVCKVQNAANLVKEISYIAKAINKI